MNIYEQVKAGDFVKGKNAEAEEYVCEVIAKRNSEGGYYISLYNEKDGFLAGTASWFCDHYIWKGDIKPAEVLKCENCGHDIFWQSVSYKIKKEGDHSIHTRYLDCYQCKTSIEIKVNML